MSALDDSRSSWLFRSSFHKFQSSRLADFEERQRIDPFCVWCVVDSQILWIARIVVSLSHAFRSRRVVVCATHPHPHFFSLYCLFRSSMFFKEMRVVWPFTPQHTHARAHTHTHKRTHAYTNEKKNSAKMPRPLAQRSLACLRNVKGYKTHRKQEWGYVLFLD
jgi:hypothetical protein